MDDPIVRTIVLMGGGITALIVFSIVGLVVVSGQRRQQQRKERKQQFNPNIIVSDNPDRASRRREIRQQLDSGYIENSLSAEVPDGLPDGEEMPSVEDLLGLDSASPAPPVPSHINVTEPTPTAQNYHPVTEPALPTFHQTASSAVPIQLHTGHQGRATELFSIMRDERDGRLIVLIGETAHRTLADSPDAKKLFSRTMKELAGVIMKPDDNPPQARTEPATPNQPIPQPPAATPAPATTTPSIQSQNNTSGPLPGDLPDYSLGKSQEVELDRLGRPKELDSTPIVNVADAIEQYLQYKIERTPQFQRRGIHIKPALSGGVIIEADGKRYEFVDEVADPEARAFIQTAIDEWQERH